MPIGDLLLVAGAVFAINLLPAFGPPTWAVLVALGLQLDLPAVPLVAMGAIAAAAGRLVLGTTARRFRDRLSAERRGHLESLRAAVTDHPAGAVAGLALFAISPVPSAQLFLAAGVTGVRLLPLTAAFFAGRVVSYSLYVGAATAAERSLGPALTDALRHPASIALQLLLLAGLVVLMRVDWTEVLERRRGRRGRGTPAATAREITLGAAPILGEPSPMTPHADQEPVRVVIVGGGVAALETVLALRDLAGSRVTLTIIAPADEFVVRPMLVAKPFAKGEMLSIPLAGVAYDVRAELIHGALAAVDAPAHQVITDDGRRIDYDALVVTVGARAIPAYPHALTFATDADRDVLCDLLRDLEAGYGHRIAFVVPPGVTWPLPMYELALMTAHQVWGMCIDDLTVHVVTPERRPLEAFGRAPSDDVQGLLDRAGILLHTATEAEQLDDGTLVLHPSGERLARTPIVALPKLEGPRIDGLPCDELGFIPVDDFGRVAHLEDVYAAGDATTCPVKQGGIAAQQADAVASMIASRAGADVEPEPFRPVLRGTLLTGREDRHLRSTEHGAGVVSEQLMWWPAGKIAGAYLAPYLVGELGSTLVDIPASATSLSVLAPVAPAATG